MLEKPKRISQYNPMGSTSTKFVNAVCRSVVDDVLSRHGVCLLEESLGWIKECSHPSPQQADGTSCGVFLVSNAECISAGRSNLHSQQHMTQFRLRIGMDIMRGQIKSANAPNAHVARRAVQFSDHVSVKTSMTSCALATWRRPARSKSKYHLVKSKAKY